MDVRLHRSDVHFVGMTYTMMDIPYWSWLPNLTHQAKEREALSVIPRFFASLAAFTVGTFGLYFIELLGHGNASTGILYLLWFVV